MNLKRTFLIICCMFYVVTTFSQNSRSRIIDSIKRVIQTQKADEKAESLLQLARHYADSEPDSSLFFIDKAYESSVIPVTKGNVYWEKTLFLDQTGDRAGVSIALDSAIDFYRRSDNFLLANALHFKNILKADAGLYSEALQIGYQELALRQKLPSRDEELNAILQIGYTYDRMGDYFKAIEWYNKGLLIDGVTNKDYIGRNYGLIGIAYDELKDYDSAVFYNRKAIDHFLSVPESAFLHTWYSNLGNTYTKMGKLDLAEKYTLLALQDKRRIRYSPMINLGKIYIEKGAFEKAEQTLDDVIQKLKKTDQKIFLSEAYYRMYELLKSKKEYPTALSYLEKYKTIEDIRINEEKLKHLNQLTVQYETLEKEKKILEQGALIDVNDMRIKRRTQWMIGISSITILILIIGFLLYRQQRLKADKIRNENELKIALADIDNRNKLQNQRLIISRDLHDNIGAHLTFIISSIDTIRQFFATKDKQLDDKLTRLSSFTRDTIQELRDTIWAMNKGALNINDLKLRIANFVEAANDSAHKIALAFKDYLPETCNLQFDSKTGMNIYRILQEAVNNAVKHSGAARIHISFEVDNQDNLIVKTEDNGGGFDPASVRNGNGIRNMRNRVQSIGGSLDIDSSPGRTSVVCVFPIKNFSNAAIN